MVKMKYLMIAFLIVIAGILAALLYFPSEEKKVKKQFVFLSEHVSKDPSESPLTMANKIRGIQSLFAEHCDFKVPDYSLSDLYTREEISGIALRGRAHFSNLSLKFNDLKVSFPEKGVARVNMTGRLTGTTVYGEQVDETREMHWLLKKVEKKWLFSRFEVIEVLKR